MRYSNRYAQYIRLEQCRKDDPILGLSDPKIAHQKSRRALPVHFNLLKKKKMLVNGSVNCQLSVCVASRGFMKFESERVITTLALMIWLLVSSAPPRVSIVR